MTTPRLARALRACASGHHAAQAAAGLLTTHACRLDRTNFSRSIRAGTSTTVIPSATITGLGQHNTARLASAILHASGQRQPSPRP